MCNGSLISFLAIDEIPAEKLRFITVFVLKNKVILIAKQQFLILIFRRAVIVWTEDFL